MRPAPANAPRPAPRRGNGSARAVPPNPRPVETRRPGSPRTRLTEEAVARAETADFDGAPFRVVGAVYLAVIAISVGRAKDFARVLALLESGAVTRADMGALAGRHGLADAWARFSRRFLDDEP